MTALKKVVLIQACLWCVCSRLTTPVTPRLIAVATMEVAIFFHVDLLRLGWLVGRRSLAQLQQASLGLYGHVGLLHEDVHILHNINYSAPLGDKICTVDAIWMFMVLHVTMDLPPGRPDNTLIIWCPKCRQKIHSYLYAGVRYQYVGQLAGCVNVISERHPSVV